MKSEILSLATLLVFDFTCSSYIYLKSQSAVGTDSDDKFD